LSVLGCYLLYVWFRSLYCIFGVLTRGVFVVIYILLWVPSWTCVTVATLIPPPSCACCTYMSRLVVRFQNDIM
jgi:hypothetical protein